MNLLIEPPVPTFIIPVIKPNQQGSEQPGRGEGRKEDGYATDEQKGRETSRPPHSLIKNNYKMY